MRVPPWITVHDLEQPGSVEWFGSLADLCRANRFDRGERRAMYAAMRAGEGWRIGGGAAPAFQVSAYWTEPGGIEYRHLATV